MPDFLAVLNAAIGWFNSNVGGVGLMILLVPTGLFLTLYFGFMQMRQLGHAFDVLRGKFDRPDDPGDISPFQALMTSLAGTVGIGNVAGVALAIYYGGPGAIFWMWMTGFCGMMTKFAECTLGIKYRKVLPDGTMAGGPMYYMDQGLKRFFGKAARGFAIFGALGILMQALGAGNMAQSNTVASQLTAAYSLPPIFTSILMTTIVLLVVVGGIKRIAKVTAKLVPFMASIYLIGGGLVLAANLGSIFPALALIVKSAFTGSAAVGGFLGATFIAGLRFGVARGLFSNEAGQGSAPIAHAAAKTKYPVREGLVAMVGPAIDTLLICTMTALIIIMTGAWTSGLQGAPMTAEGLQLGLGAYSLGWLAKHIVAITVFFFGLSTALSWCYYGDRAVEFIFGFRWIRVYRYVFCAAHFVGGIWALDLVWNITDMGLAWVAIPNLIAILFLSRELRSDTKEYLAMDHKPVQS